MKNKILVTLILLFSSILMAQTNSPTIIPFQAVITDASDVPLVSTPVTVVIQITDGPGTCALYQETQSGTTDSKGVVSFAVGQGGAQSFATGTGGIFKNVFRNNNTSITACVGGGTSTLTPSMGRKIRFNVNGGGMSTGVDIGTVGFSYFAEKANDSDMLGGWSAANYLDINGVASMGAALKLQTWAGPPAGTAGAIGFNTSSSQLQYYDGGSWVLVPTTGGGSVTNVSVSPGNGFAGSVATSTTTPAITLSTPLAGVLKGTGTGLAVALVGDFPTLNQNTTGTAANVTGTVALANGGTNSALAASAGSVAYSNAGSIQLTAVGTAGQVLTSAGAGTPTWTTPSTTDATKLPLAGGTMSGAIAMGGNAITNLLDPAAAQDAATKNYVDTKFLTKTLPAAPTVAQHLQALRWNNGTTTWEYFTPGGGGGDFYKDGSVQMTGPLQLQNWAASGPCAGVDKGKTGFNTSTNKFEYCDGASWVAVSAAGTGDWLKDGSVTASGNFNLGGFKIVNVADGSVAQDVMTFGQVNAVIAASGAPYIRKDGTVTMSANFNMGGYNMTNLNAITGSNVGIGTTSPSRTLDVSGIVRISGNNSLELTDGSNFHNIGFDGAIFGGGSPDLAINVGGSNNMRFYTNGTERIRVDSGGNVGIGISSPGFGLDVSGDINIPTASANGYRKNGVIILNHPNNATNILVGANAGNAAMSGNNNTAVGNLALNAVTSGAGNTALGASAGTANTIGTNNTFVGYLAGNTNLGQADNTYVGANSGKGAVAQYGVIMGSSAGGGGSTGLTGNYNTMLGYRAGYVNTSGAQNVFVGETAGYSNISGSQNTFVGDGAGKLNTVGSNTYIGASAGYNNSTGGNGTYVGFKAGYSSIGSGNTLLGYQAGVTATSGTNNTVIGNNADLGGLTSDAVAIGNAAVVTANGAVQIGAGTNNNPDTIKYQGVTIANKTTGSTPIYIGNTAGTYIGSAVSGYTGGRAKCEAQFPTEPGVHMCTVNEISVYLQYGTPTGNPWIISGQYHDEYDGSYYIANDCAGFTGSSSNGWVYIGPQMEYRSCGFARPIACCR